MGQTFPDYFFEQVYRLQAWEYRPGTSKRSRLVGHFVNRFIYDVLPEGVHEELRELNPTTPSGYRAYKHFQFLTADSGSPHLDKQISTVITLTWIAKDRSEFEDLFA